MHQCFWKQIKWLRSDVYVHYFPFFSQCYGFWLQTFGPQEEHYARLVQMRNNGDRQQQWEGRGEAAADIRNLPCVFVLTLCVSQRNLSLMEGSPWAKGKCLRKMMDVQDFLPLTSYETDHKAFAMIVLSRREKNICKTGNYSRTSSFFIIIFSFRILGDNFVNLENMQVNTLYLGYISNGPDNV